jgi:hypothetical protein
VLLGQPPCKQRMHRGRPKRSHKPVLHSARLRTAKVPRSSAALKGRAQRPRSSAAPAPVPRTSAAPHAAPKCPERPSAPSALSPPSSHSTQCLLCCFVSFLSFPFLGAFGRSPLCLLRHRVAFCRRPPIPRGVQGGFHENGNVPENGKTQKICQITTLLFGAWRACVEKPEIVLFLDL